MIAAAVDHRVKAVISTVPFTSGESYAGAMPKEQLDYIYANRTHNVPSEYIPLFHESAEDVGKESPHKPVLSTMDAYEYSLEAKERARGAKWENKISIQTMYHMLKNEPINFVHRIAPRPLLFVVAKKDTTLNPEDQMKTYERAGEGKELLELDGGHFDAYRGEGFKTNIKAQVEFLKKHL